MEYGTRLIRERMRAAMMQLLGTAGRDPEAGQAPPWIEIADVFGNRLKVRVFFVLPLSALSLAFWEKCRRIFDLRQQSVQIGLLISIRVIIRKSVESS